MPTGIPGSRSVPTCHPEAEYQGKGLCKVCYQVEFRKTHPDKRDRREENVRKRFGISLEEYLERRQRQRDAGDLCGLCKLPLGEDAYLDHNHETGELREFLHRKCNAGIGFLGDSLKLCRLAAEYLEKHIGDYNVRVEEKSR